MRIVSVAKQFVPFPVILHPTNIHPEVNVAEMHVWEHHNEPAKCLCHRHSTCGIGASEALHVVVDSFETVRNDPGKIVVQ